MARITRMSLDESAIPTERSFSMTGVSRTTSRFIVGTTIEKPPNTDGSGVIGMLNHPLNLMLIFLPLGMAASFLDWGKITIFSLNFLALIPLAKILGDATEELAAGLHSDVLAGLLNATFGNAVEMVMMIQTLRAGLTTVVKATLLGSILSNVLLVLGMSFFCGGLVGPKKTRTTVLSSLGLKPEESQGLYRPPGSEFVSEKVQSFSVMTALVNTSMLLLASLVLCLVTIFYREAGDEAVYGELGMTHIILGVSRVCSVIMMVSYVAYIFFQLVTHRLSMAEDVPEGGEGGEGDDGEGDPPAVSIPTAITMMMVVTLVVAYCSELLIESLDGVVEKARISEHFIGIILLPIVGNACEHASAVRFAIMDKPGLAIGIAVGSSTQISMFVVPFSVIVGWIIDKDMDLNFGSLNTTVLMVSIIVVLSIVVDGQANWLQGYLLMSAYLIIAVLYFWMPNGESFRES
mmetsp:Transcript_43285/g.92643  ORF Transcript_43285/g.92643 Transcript_43285/m.92643 type:complete len:462 (-) Transcript_43285:214-1599(-)